MELKIGDKAPEFKGQVAQDSYVELKDFLGKRVILFFYPRDNTPTCTVEACNLRDNYMMLQEKGYVVLGISTDDSVSHEKFSQKHKLPFPLIADTDKKIHELYHTWGEKSMFGKKFFGTKRTTFVIDEQGIIAQIFKKVNSKDHANQILEKEKL